MREGEGVGVGGREWGKRREEGGTLGGGTLGGGRKVRRMSCLMVECGVVLTLADWMFLTFDADTVPRFLMLAACFWDFFFRRVDELACVAKSVRERRGKGAEGRGGTRLSNTKFTDLTLHAPITCGRGYGRGSVVGE